MVRVPLESLDQAAEFVPDIRIPLLNLVNRSQYTLNISLVKELLEQECADNQEKPQWPSAEADKLLKNPSLLLTKRFPSVIGDIIHEIESDLKPKADALILDSVTRCVQHFNNEVACVETWRKKMSRVEPPEFYLEFVSEERMSELCEEVVFIFLRYTAAMLREVRARVRQLVERTDLIESCAGQRREIISRLHLVQQASDGMSKLIPAHQATAVAAETATSCMAAADGMGGIDDIHE